MKNGNRLKKFGTFREARFLPVNKGNEELLVASPSFELPLPTTPHRQGLKSGWPGKPLLRSPPLMQKIECGLCRLHLAVVNISH